MEKEVLKMQGEIESVGKEWGEKMKAMADEKEQAEKRAAKFKAQLEKIKNAPKPAVKIDLTEKATPVQSAEV